MVLPDPATLGDSVATSPARFRQVETFADLDSLLSLLERGFGMPPEIAGVFPIRLLFLAATWLAATGDDGDVSTGLGFVHDGWCGIFNVATPEEQPRPGLRQRGDSARRRVGPEPPVPTGRTCSPRRWRPARLRAARLRHGRARRQWMPSGYVR